MPIALTRLFSCFWLSFWTLGVAILTGSFPLTSHAQGVPPVTSVCTQHDFSAGGFSSCTYCHNAEDPGDAAFTISSKSQTCLSCHDGSTTEAAQHISPGSTTQRIQQPLLVNKNTAMDHPFGVSYDEARLMNTSLKLRPNPVSPVVRLYEGQVECASCHDPHDCSNKPFLRMSNEKSAMCMTCHEM